MQVVRTSQGGDRPLRLPLEIGALKCMRKLAAVILAPYDSTNPLLLPHPAGNLSVGVAAGRDSTLLLTSSMLWRNRATLLLSSVKPGSRELGEGLLSRASNSPRRLEKQALGPLQLSVYHADAVQGAFA